MPTSFGLIDDNGSILRSSGDFSVAKSAGVFKLEFDRDVTTAVVVASHHRPFCDALGGDRPIQIGKSNGEPEVVCVIFADGQFSFILIDDGEEGEALEGGEEEDSGDPQLSSVDPDSVSQGATSEINLLGVNFRYGARAMVDARVLRTELVSSRELRASLTQQVTGTVGTKTVKVHNSDGTLSNGLPLEVVAATGEGGDV